MKPRGRTARCRGQRIYEAEAKARCNEAKAKAEAVIFGLKALEDLTSLGSASTYFG